MVLTAFLWGTSFPAIKWGLRYLNPLSFVFWRFAVATAFFLPLMVVWRGRFLREVLSPHLAVLGLINTLGYLLEFLGMNYTTSVKASIIVNLSSVLAVPLSVALLGEGLWPVRGLGVLLAGVGVFAVITGGTLKRLGGGTLTGDLLCLAASLFWALEVAYSKMALRKAGTLTAAAAITLYTLVFLTALLPWIYFNDATLASCPVYLRFRDVVKKIYFPRWSLPMSIVSSSFVHFALSMIILFAVFMVVPVRFTAKFWILIPMTLILTIFLAGISLLVSVLHTYYQDVEYALGALIRVFFFVTPVMYPTTEIPEQYRFWFLFNPMATICEGFRSVLPGYHAPEPIHLLSTVIVALLTLGLGIVVYRRMSAQLPEVL